MDVDATERGQRHDELLEQIGEDDRTDMLHRMRELGNDTVLDL